MITRKTLAWAGMGLLAGALLVVTAAEAQTAADSAGDAPAAAAPQKAKPRAHKARAAQVAVVVTDQRAVPLTALFAAPTGSSDSKKIVGSLDPGKKIVVRLPHDKACLFDLHGEYADGTKTDAEGVELCKDKKINLIE